jgi:hypothetical protein
VKRRIEGVAQLDLAKSLHAPHVGDRIHVIPPVR